MKKDVEKGGKNRDGREMISECSPRDTQSIFKILLTYEWNIWTQVCGTFIVFFFQAPGVGHCGGGNGPFPGNALEALVKRGRPGIRWRQCG